MGEPVPRSIRITEELLQQLDYTKGCPKCGAMKRDEKSDTVHHSKLCRSRIEDEMKKDDVLSRRFAGVEERKTQFLARKVQESDQRRVEERDAEEQAEHVGVLETQQGCAKPPSDASLRCVNDVGFLEEQKSVKPVATCDSGPGVTGGEEGEAVDKICSWIECSHDQRSWAEATEDQNRALPFTPVPARVEEAGPTMCCGPVGDHGAARTKHIKGQ